MATAPATSQKRPDSKLRIRVSTPCRRGSAMEELSLFTLESLARTGAQELTRLPVLLLEPVGEVLSMQKESVGLLQEGRKNTLETNLEKRIQ